MSLAVGVDVGGTKIAAGVVDDSGRIVDRTRVPSPADDPAQLVAAVVDAVEELRTRHDVTAVGVGAAGFVAEDRDHIHFSPHLEWGTGPVATPLAERLGLPVVIENDANAAAWAEHVYGAGQGVEDQLMITVGTGIGGGMILSGEPYRGGHGIAAEVGHLTVVRGGRQCECGRRGCWEEYASGSSLQRNAQEAAARGEVPSVLAAADGSVAAVTGTLVTRMAEQGDPDAVALLVGLAEWLATGLSSLVSVLDPSVIVVGGGVSAAGPLLLEPLTTALHADISGGSLRPVPEVRLAVLGNDAGMVGCADLARRS